MLKGVDKNVSKAWGITKNRPCHIANLLTLLTIFVKCYIDV